MGVVTPGFFFYWGMFLINTSGKQTHYFLFFLVYIYAYLSTAARQGITFLRLPFETISESADYNNNDSLISFFKFDYTVHVIVSMA